MNSKINQRIFAFFGIVLFVSLFGCKDLFKDPLADKETGDKITVLLTDRNFITTKLAIRVEDLVTGQPIVGEPVEVSFVGNDANGLITFTGKKQTTYMTSSGFVEVGYDPGVTINDQNPLEMTVAAGSANYISAPQFISYTSEGIKNLVIKMFHKSTLKSAKILAFDEPFDLKYNGQTNSSSLHFEADFSSSPTGTAWEYLNLYTTTANGALTCTNLKEPVLYSDYGVYIVNPNKEYSIAPPELPTKSMTLKTNDFVYSAVLPSGMSKCDKGLTIHVDRSNGINGTGVFDYIITFSDGKTKTGKISCTFPSDNTAVKVKLIGDAQYDISPEVNLSSPCNKTATFTAKPKSNLKTYKLITRYSCPNSVVGIGLSIIGEFRKKGATDNWTSFKFIEGVGVLQLVPDSDYDFRFNIDSKYYNYTLPTNPDKVKTALQDDSSPDFKFRNLSITSTATEVSITTDVEFSQGVCDLFN